MNTKYEESYYTQQTYLNLVHLIKKLIYEYRKLKGQYPTKLYLNSDTLVLLKNELYLFTDFNMLDNKFMGLDIIIKIVDGNNKFNIYYEVQ